MRTYYSYSRPVRQHKTDWGTMGWALLLILEVLSILALFVYPQFYYWLIWRVIDLFELIDGLFN